MILLIKLLPKERPDNAAPDELARILFDIAKNVYNDTASNSEAYLRQPHPDADFAAELRLLDGADNPNYVKNIANAWNQQIAMDFERALNAAETNVQCAPDPIKNGARRQWLTCPAPKIYDLKKAVLALDGVFYEYADKALLVNPNGGFTTLLTDDQIKDINTNPQNYAVIEVFPK